MNPKEKETVLVTGGAGYIGSHVCYQLAQAGYLPVVFDNLSTGHDWAVKWGPLIHGDLRNASDIDDAVSRYNPQTIMHLGGDISVGDSVTHPDRHYRNNVGATMELLSALRRWKIPNLVFTSSCTVYGTPTTPILREDHPLNPINPYGRSKLMCERLIGDFAHAYGTKAGILRLFNAAGAEHNVGLGEARRHETHLIPLALDFALGRIKFVIHGQDYDTPDGTCIRDYVHVADIANATIAAMRKLNTEVGGYVGKFNIAQGTGFSVRQILENAATITGKSLACPVHARRSGDVSILVGDNSLAKQELGWTANRSEVVPIIESAWHWRKTHALPGTMAP